MEMTFFWTCAASISEVGRFVALETVGNCSEDTKAAKVHSHPPAKKNKFYGDCVLATHWRHGFSSQCYRLS